MDNSTQQRIQDLLSKNDKIGIVVGKNPNLDQMAAALSLYLAFKSANKTVSIASPTEPIVANSSLVGIDKVKGQLSGDGGDLIVSFPYTEGEIEKVSYTLEGGFLNIVVKATEEGLSFSENDVLFKRSAGIPTLLFVVGTPRLSDLGSLFDADALKNTSVVNIDNSSENQNFGDVVLVSSKFSSLSEQVANIIRSLDINIEEDIAQNLLSGINFATDSFQNPNTSYLAFEMAGFLMKKGAKRVNTKSQSVQQDRTFQGFSQPSQQMQPRRDQQPRETGSGSNRQRPWDRSGQQSQNNRPQLQQRQTQPQQASQASEPTVPDWLTPPKQERPQQQNRPQPRQQTSAPAPAEDKNDQEAPPDWLTPKVYKSSTLI